MSCHFDFLLFYKYSDFSSYRHNCVCLKIGEYYKFKGTAVLGDEQLAVPSVTLSTEGSAIEFAVSGGVVDGDDGAVNEPMHWVVVVRKNGKEIDRKTLTFEDGKEIATDDLKLYYK